MDPAMKSEAASARSSPSSPAWIVALVLVLAMVVGLNWRGGAEGVRGAVAVPESGGTDATAARDDADAAGAEAGLGFMEEGMPIWSNGNFRQTLFATNFRDIRVLDEMKSGGTWSSLSFTRTANFDVLRVASATRDVFALAGFDEDGDFVLQRWKLQSNIAVEPPVLVPKHFVVVEIFRGPLAPEIRALEFDAETRFILALLRDPPISTLYRFENVPGATPTVHSDSTAVPALAVMNYMKKFDHSEVGRLWRLDDNPVYNFRVFLVDFENDGVFDGPPFPITRLAWESTGLDAYDFWDPLMGP